MVHTHRAIDSELLQTRADLLHNREILRSQLVVRNGFSRLLLDHGLPFHNTVRDELATPRETANSQVSEKSPGAR
jgi:hypothetical protein